MEVREDNTTAVFGPGAAGADAAPPTYWLTRFMLLRLLGGVYALAFLVAINQVVALIGTNGR